MATLTSSEKVFRRVFNWAWHRPTSTRPKVGICHQLTDDGGKEKIHSVSLTFEEDFHTGSWHTDGYVHRVILGGGWVFQMTPSSQKKESHVKACYESLARHEIMGHGIHTSDTKVIMEYCREMKIPFEIFNLAEDGRTDALNAIKDGKLRWSNWLEIPKICVRPIDWLHMMVNEEASTYKHPSLIERKYDWLGKSVTRKGNDFKRRVRWYYRKIVKAKETKNLIPIIEMWVDEFGIDCPKGGLTSSEIEGENWGGSPGKSRGGKEGDGPTGVGYSEGHGMGNRVPPGMSLDEVKAKDERASSVNLSYFSNRHVYNWDEGIVGRIQNTVTQITRSASLDRDELGSTGNMIHLPGIISGSDQYTRVISEADGEKVITVVVDMSSSMTHTWISHGGQEFVIALTRLHKKNVLDVRLWLTGGGNCHRLDIRSLTDEDIGKIMPECGYESFAYTLQNAEKDMLESDLTICWTDGQISDGDVDCKAIRQKGIDIIGLAPRNSEDRHIADNMRRHFGKGFVGMAEQLAKKVTHYILSKEATE